MAQTTLSVRLDSADKKRFEEFCSETGMNVSVAINMFIKAVLRESRIPFSIECDIPNEETRAILDDVINGRGMSRSFSSVSELMEDLNADD